MASKRARIDLTASEKREIVLFSNAHGNKSQQEIANHFCAKWNKSVKRRTIGDVLAKKEHWLHEVSENSLKIKRKRGGKNGDMEKALFLWFSSARAKNLPVSDEILRSKARFFGDSLQMDEFSYSNGWLQRFKTRYGIASRRLGGESASVNDNLVQTGIEKAREILKDYEPKNVFNMDETGLFYQMLPDRCLTTANHSKGTKKAKNRITLVVCANADGSEKDKLLVIGKSANPRCFRNFQHRLYCEYRSNKKAWMTSVLFSDWLHDFDRRMRSAGRKVLLLMDNAPSHIIPQNENGESPLTNVKIHFLPPMTTSHLQPMDAGVIMAFKSHYRQLQIQHLIDCMDSNQEPKIELSDAIRFSKIAWDRVTPKTIENCYKHTRITPPEWSNANNDSEVPQPSNVIESGPGNIFDRIAEFFQIDQTTLMTQEEFNNVDAYLEPTEVLSDDQILDMVNGSKDLVEDNDSETETPQHDEPPVSASDARKAISTILRYIESNERASSTDVNAATQLKNRLDDLITSSLSQRKLTEFFK